MERHSDLLARLPLNPGVRARCIGEIANQRHFPPHLPQLVKREIRSDPTRPGAKTSRRIKPRMRSMHFPERFHRQILRYPAVANDAHDPAEDLALKLAEQRLECVFIAVCE